MKVTIEPIIHVPKRRMSPEFKGLLDLFRKEGLAYANNMLHMIETDELPYPKSTTKQKYYDASGNRVLKSTNCNWPKSNRENRK